MKKIIRIIYNQEPHKKWIIKLFETINYGVKKDEMAYLGVHFDVIESSNFHYDIKQYETDVYHVFFLHERRNKTDDNVEGAYIPVGDIKEFFNQLNGNDQYHNFFIISGGIFKPFETRIIMTTKMLEWKTLEDETNNLYHIIFSILVQWYQFLQPNKNENIFLSHKSEQGKPIIDAKEFRQFLDRTKLPTFIDRKNIVDRLDKNLEDGIKESSLIVVIYTDDYLDSHWCDFELLTARKYNIPILVLNCTCHGNYEIHEGTINAPFLKINDKFDKIGIALFQMLIQRYFLKQQAGDVGVKVLYTKPSHIDFINSENYSKYTYSFPPLTEQQKQLIMNYDKPLFLIGEEKEICLSEYQIMLLTSEVNDEKTSLLAEEYRILVQIIYLYFISKKASILYAGNINYEDKNNNVVNFLINMNSKYQKRDKNYTSEVDTNKKLLLYGERNMLDVDYLEKLAQEEFILLPDKETSEKRIESIKKSDVIVLFGGKTEGYSDSLSGILVEYLVARKKEKIIYIIGGYGGVAKHIGSYVYMKKEWKLGLSDNQKEQIDDMRKKLLHDGKQLNISNDTLSCLMKQLALPEKQANGLSKEENRKLLETTDIYEALNLIGKGMQNLTKGATNEN